MSFRQKLFLKVFGLTKVPLIWWTRARIVELDDRRCVIRIPFKRRNKNHVGSMYFGVLAVGADVAGGLLAVARIRREKLPVGFLFKSFKAQFHKRAEGHTYFTCEDGPAIAEMIDETMRTGERVNRVVRITATVPDKLGDEPVATFDLELSLKRGSP